MGSLGGRGGERRGGEQLVRRRLGFVPRFSFSSIFFSVSPGFDRTALGCLAGGRLWAAGWDGAGRRGCWARDCPGRIRDWAARTHGQRGETQVRARADSAGCVSISLSLSSRQHAHPHPTPAKQSRAASRSQASFALLNSHPRADSRTDTHACPATLSEPLANAHRRSSTISEPSTTSANANPGDPEVGPARAAQRAHALRCAGVPRRARGHTALRRA